MLSETQIISSHLMNSTNASRLLFARWETISLPMQPKVPDITKVRLATFGIAVVGADHSMGQTYAIKAISRIHRVPDELAEPMNEHGIADHYRVTVLHYLLDIG